MKANEAGSWLRRRAGSHANKKGYEPGFSPKASINTITRRRTAKSLIRMKAFRS